MGLREHNTCPSTWPTKCLSTTQCLASSLIGIEYCVPAIQNDARIRNRAGTRNLAYDPEKSYVGRSRIAPGAEPQILILLTGADDCWNGSCAGYAIEKVGNEWVELTDLRGFVDGGFGFVALAAEPILARLRNAVTLENDTTATIEPVNDGRRTLIWNDRGYTWSGTRCRIFCWREP